MGPQVLLFALAFAHGALAFLEGYVTVTHIEEDVVLRGINGINVNAFAGVVVAAATTDLELVACASADAVLSSCVASGWLADTAPVESAQSCLCCHDGQTLIDEYSSCSTYIAREFPTETAAFSTVSLLYGICELGTCAGGATTPTTSPSTPTTPTTTLLSAPAACTSFVSVFASCSTKIPGWTTIALSSMASCLCYDLLGNYNTKFDDYADSCAPFAKTAIPEEYTAISALGSFCSEFPPNGGGGSKRLTTTSGGAAGFGGLGQKSTTTASAAGSASSTVTVTVPPPSGQAPGGVAMPGAFTWLVSLLPFFILV